MLGDGVPWRGRKGRGGGGLLIIDVLFIHQTLELEHWEAMIGSAGRAEFGLVLLRSNVFFSGRHLPLRMMPSVEMVQCHLLKLIANGI